ncbi:Nitrate regulatory gene2 protein [Thalictrum thalictroides]|uniref:Nitrate regulatory gene2 protein n=1 Tax=Thalictrum thalictroides TaxID=46969 RepID=A0A7J6W4H3_THATH|nr:Nitrate regulatory gene2 protein [Thalictrum thalictroides]
MGCTSSKLDDLPAVALCKERCNYLDEAIVQRYALAEAHVAYIHSLKLIGYSLDRFFDQDLIDNNNSSSSSPFLNLPPHKKGDPVVPVVIDNHNTPSDALPSVTASAAAAVKSHSHSHSHSHSSSGSHLHFHTDSDDDEEDDDEDGSHLHFHGHSGHSSPLHYQPPLHYEDEDSFNGGGGGFMSHMNFMRNRFTPSVVHEQRPISPETVYMTSHSGGGEPSSSSSASYYPNYYPNQENPNPNSYGYYNNYPPPSSSYSNSNYGFYGSGGSPPYGGSGYPGYPPQQQQHVQAVASSSKPPPPPPSPPRASAWDFLNPFETFDNYTQNTPSRDSRSVREEEGIPDLEDDHFQDEVVKEVHGDQKFNDGGGNYMKKKKKKMAEEEEERGIGGEAIYETNLPTASNEINGMEYEVNLVDKKVVANEERSEEKSNNVPSFKVKIGSRGASVVIREIKSQFERASESGNEVSMMLEVGKVPFHKKNAVYQVSSKMLHSITPSLSVVSSQPSTSKSVQPATMAGSVYIDMDDNVGLKSGNLSSTLQKLYIWEKKLYDEVKAEEKMRIVHDRKVRRLKRLDERGAEAQKIDATRTLVRSLSTKIRIAIQVVDKISIKINKLRDEELWPQMNELIQGYAFLMVSTKT